ncbi:MFS transporter [Salmonella enterica subsp. enterica serovar Choleraesuis]|nr:MFS transporter [Salmonella enterica subsp. enterica serovar Choleraesuis]
MPAHHSPTNSFSRGWLLIGILAIATTLRVTFTGIAPLLGTLGNDLQLTTAQTGILTTLPLIAFAIFSPLAAGVARRLSTERALAVALLMIIAGIFLRSSGTSSALYIGTATIGCGIALGNVLLPSLIKRDFSDNVARLTGAYSLTMGVAAALGSVAMVPLALWGLGWRGALLCLMAFPVLALVLWLPQLTRPRQGLPGNSPALNQRGIWRSALAWQVTFFLGLNSLVYYVVIGWLPSILVSQGFTSTEAGSLHGLMQLSTAAPGLIIGLVLGRLKDQRGVAASVSILCAISALGLWLMPALASLWVVLFGFGSGATMILGLTFIGLRASSAHQAAALSGMAQSVGYLLAAFGPPLMGMLHDVTGHWAAPLAAVALLAILMAVAGACAGRDREIIVAQPERA